MNRRNITKLNFQSGELDEYSDIFTSFPLKYVILK